MLRSRFFSEALYESQRFLAAREATKNTHRFCGICDEKQEASSEKSSSDSVPLNDRWRGYCFRILYYRSYLH